MSKRTPPKVSFDLTADERAKDQIERIKDILFPKPAFNAVEFFNLDEDADYEREHDLFHMPVSGGLQ